MMSLLRVFKVVDADEFTRDYHQRTLGVTLAPAQVRRSVGGAPSHGPAACHVAAAAAVAGEEEARS